MNSKIDGTIDHRNATTDATFDQFLEQSTNYAKMIYNTDKSFECEHTLKDCRDLARLKELTKTDVVLITEPELARGIDYRVQTSSGTEGIALFVMSSAANLRAYVQLLGRVGRYSEECKRFKLDNLDPFDVLA